MLVHEENGMKCGREVLFPTNLDLADILGGMDLDFDNLYFGTFWTPNLYPWTYGGSGFGTDHAIFVGCMYPSHLRRRSHRHHLHPPCRQHCSVPVKHAESGCSTGPIYFLLFGHSSK